MKLLLLSPLAPRAAATCPLPSDQASPRRLASILGALGARSESVRVIGAAYLRLSPSALDESRDLERTILGGGGSEASAGSQAEVTSLKTMLRARIRGDFASGSTVWLHGWLLSRTEAALCSLAVLTDEGRL
jgi:hypothetical protein